MSLDIVVDIETLGLNPRQSPIIQISAVVVRGGEILGIQFDKCSEETEGASESTLQWWSDTNTELLKKIQHRGLGVSEKELVGEFLKWIKTISNLTDTSLADTLLWGKGPSFDNEFLKEKCLKYKYDWPLSHQNDMCIRTVNQFRKELSLNNIEFEGVRHDALADAKYEAEQLIQLRSVIQDSLSR